MNDRKRLLTDGKLSIIIVAAILLIDQIIKIAVKSHMCLGESIRVTDWFYILFIENNGMAYGMTFFNKLVLSVFRIVAIGFIATYMVKLLRWPHTRGYMVCLSMVLAGAAGNLLDSMFYGLAFDSSTPYSVAELVPFGSGYAPFLYGKVVDMFYFPLIVSIWPDWVPICGGQEFIFFSPIFNFADACISVGFVLLLIFYRNELETISQVFRRKQKEEADE